MNFAENVPVPASPPRAARGADLTPEYVLKARQMLSLFKSVRVDQIKETGRTTNPTALAVDAAGSDAPGFQRCKCCGQAGRKRSRCSCVGGKSHQCLTLQKGGTPRNILENYKAPFQGKASKTTSQKFANPSRPSRCPPAPTTEEIEDTVHQQIILLRWTRLIKKIQPYLNMTEAEWEVLEKDVMLDDSPDEPSVNKRGRA